MSALTRRASTYLIARRCALTTSQMAFNSSIKIISSSSKIMKYGELICKTNSRFRQCSAQTSHNPRTMLAALNQWYKANGHRSIRKLYSSNWTTASVLFPTLDIISRIQSLQTLSAAMYRNQQNCQLAQRRHSTPIVDKLWWAMSKTTTTTHRRVVSR